MIAFGRATRIWSVAGLLAYTALSATCAPAANEPLQAAFENPPPTARPWVFWYWNKCAISHDGITADLEAMHKAGIGGAYLMTIKGPDAQLWNPPVVQLSPPWWDAIRHAFAEANRLGLQLAMHACDGFATAGGPWITPDRSMQKVVWSEHYLRGGSPFRGKLPQPKTNEGFYRDIATFAIPVSYSEPPKPRVTTSLADFDANFLVAGNSDSRIRMDQPGWIQFEYTEPFECRTITVRPDGNSFQAQRLAISVSDDGQQFRDIGRLEPPRHGWQNGKGTVTHAIEPTIARFFRFTYDPAGSEPGAEDLDSAKWKPSLKLRGLELSAQPRVHQFESKNGSVWRVGRRTTSSQLADTDCVQRENIINISDYLHDDGTLQWDTPAGDWLILRMGHTSTGAHNETGGGGRGLECDKFDPGIVRLHFDRWFGEVIRQIGPELANRVLKGFHVDSWECGSQNWSSRFPDEFERRRGYDLLPYLPVLAGVPIESADVSERVLHDLRQTITELITDHFFGALKKLAHQQDCWFSAECVAPTMVSDGLRHFGIVDIPMGEFWLRSPTHDKPNDMRDAISAAHVYGKPVVQAEAFTELRMAWDEHPGMLKALGDRHFAMGVNRLVYHVFNHNPWIDRAPGMTLDRIGLYAQRNQTWWPLAKAWTDYHARCQSMLQAGTPVVDIAVFTGESIPSRAVLPEALVTTLPGIVGKHVVGREQARLTNAGNPLQELPQGVNASANITAPHDWLDPLRGYAYDSVNADALLRLAEVKDNRICFPGGASYRMLVLPMPRPLAPHPERMTPELARRLGELVEAGATIVACVHGRGAPGLTNFPAADAELTRILGEPPAEEILIDERPGQIRTIGKGRLVYGPLRTDSFLPYEIEPDLLCYTAAGKRLHDVAWCHRRSDEADWYFLSNQSDAERQLVVSLRMEGKQAELWDPLTGEVQPTRQANIHGRSVIPIRLAPHGSVFIVFRSAAGKEVVAKDWAARDYHEVAVLDARWSVTFAPPRGGPPESVEFNSLTDWSVHDDENVRYYSGTATYVQTFEWDGGAGRTWLDLGDVANLARVQLNGIECGTTWAAPYRVDVTDALRQGENELQIDVTNTWANRLIGDARLPIKQRTTWMTAPGPPADAELQPAGLLGPVRLLREASPSQDD